jgi:hypothetical protein
MVFTEHYKGFKFSDHQLQHGLDCSHAAKKDTPMFAYHKNQPKGYTQEYDSSYYNTAAT